LALEEREYRGRAGIATFFDRFTEDFEEWSFTMEQFVDAGEGRVVAVVKQQAVGKGSGAAVQWRLGQIGHLRDGCLVRTVNYLTPEEAFEAAGLPAPD
jgi:ketosteroid isomerase-like protein